jgi:hypothetical protein
MIRWLFRSGLFTVQKRGAVFPNPFFQTAECANQEESITISRMHNFLCNLSYIFLLILTLITAFGIMLFMPLRMILSHVAQYETRFFGRARIAHESMGVRAFCMLCESFWMSFRTIPIYCCAHLLFHKMEIHAIAAILSIHNAIYSRAPRGL